MKTRDADQPLDDHEPRRVDSIGSQLVSSAGPTLKSMSAKPIAIANEKMICPRADLGLDLAVLVALLGEATFAEIASARKPIASDSPSAMTPRITGSRQIRWRCIGDVIVADDLRRCRPRACGRDGPARRAAHHHAFEHGLTAVGHAHVGTVPTMAGCASLADCGAGLLEAALEALHPAARVDELLLARVERMALGADLDVELGLRRARQNSLPHEHVTCATT